MSNPFGKFPVVAVAAVLCFSIVAHGQLSPPEALAALEPAAHLEVTLFAAEPDLVNPTIMDVDAHGRVWVAEAANYRLFNQPMTRREGDRIRILEDTDGDGRCDKATTFYQDPSLQAPMGLAVLGDRVYVCQSPDLFYLQDTDGDGVADKKTVVLTGFKGIDNDHAIHGVMFGPDGRLYMSNGDQGLDVTDKSGNRVHAGRNAPIMAATVLRTDLDGKLLECLAEGMRNPYEPAVDAFGNVFISDNDDDGNEQVRINYIMEGGNYGYWPKRKGNRKLGEVHWNEDRPGVVTKMVRTGFGSPCGLLVYEGALLPPRWRGALIHADSGPRVIRAYPYRPDGAGFRSGIEELVSSESDTWFRPSDVCVAPDGSIFIADWYDAGVGGHRMADVERGRVYRLAPKGHAYQVPPLDLTSDKGIIDAFCSPNQARRYLAYRLLEARLAQGDSALLRSLWESGNVLEQSRTLWLLARDPNHGDAALRAAHRHDNPKIRTQAMRVAAMLGPPPLREACEHLHDPRPQVRRQLLLELARCAQEPWAQSAILELAEQFDGKDRFYREAVGIACKGREAWAWEQLLERCGDAWDERLAGLAIQLHPESAIGLAGRALANKRNSQTLRKLAVDALDAIGTKASGEVIVSSLDTLPRAVCARALHQLARDEGDAWRSLFESRPMVEFLRRTESDPALREIAYAFVREARFTPMLPRFVERATDSSMAVEAKVEALGVVAALAPRVSAANTRPIVAKLAGLAAESGDEKVAIEAYRALGAFKGNFALEALENGVLDERLPRSVRQAVLGRLFESKPGALAVLRLAEQQKLPAELTLDATERAHASVYEDVRLIAERVLPRPSTSDGSQLPSVADLLRMTGDAARGRETFFNPERAQCYRCHMINGEGKNVGPELSTIGQKAGPDALLESILNPSAAVAPEYKVWLIETELEGLLTGFIRAENSERIELVDASGNATSIAAGDVLSRTTSSASLMPNGLTAALSAQELVDLVAFLRSLK